MAVLILTTSLSLPTAATPVISPAAGTYSGSQSVTISSSTSGTVIHYTTDGTTPTAASSVYSGALTISTSQTVQAIAIASGFQNSAIASAAYVIEVAAATPTFNPAAGSYAGAKSVTITSPNGGTIYYTLNGSTPTTASSVYSAALNVSATTTIKAIATPSGYLQSAVGSAAYTIMPSVSIAVGSGTFANNLINASGTQVLLSGFNLPGLELSGAQGDAPWYGNAPPDIPYLVSLGANAFRIPINIATYMGRSCCTLNSSANGWVSNTPVSADPGSGFFAAFNAVLAQCHSYGCVTFVDVHCSMPEFTFGGVTAYAMPLGQHPFPSTSDLPFYQSFANTYGTQSTTVPTGVNPNLIILEPMNEPYVDYDVLNSTVYGLMLNGGTLAQYTYTDEGGTAHTVAQSWSVLGNQTILNAIRAINANNVLGFAGPGYAHSMASPASWLPVDTLSVPQIAAIQHLYPNDTTYSGGNYYPEVYPDSGSGTSAWSVNSLAVLNTTNIPVLVTEMGGNYGPSLTSEPQVAYLTGFLKSNAYSAILIWQASELVSSTSSGQNCALTTSDTLTDGEGVAFAAFLSGQGNVGQAQPRQSVEATSSGGDPGGDVFSRSGSFSEATLAGSTILVQAYYSHDIETAGSCADSKGNTYTQLEWEGDPTSNGDEWFMLFAAQNAAALSPTDTITFSTAGTDYTGFQAVEIEGVISASVVSHNSNYQTGLTGAGANHINSGNLTCGSGSGIIVAFSSMTTENGTAPYAPTPQSGYTLGGNYFEDTVYGNDSLATWEWLSVTNYGTNPAYFNTLSGYSNDSTVTLAVFLAASTAGATATPTFSPAAGSYGGAQSVTIASTTSGAAIYYTTDGTTPTVSSTLYSGPVSVAATKTLKALATSSGLTNSAVATAAYTIGSLVLPGVPGNFLVLYQGQTSSSTTSAPPTPTNGNTQTLGWSASTAGTDAVAGYNIFRTSANAGITSTYTKLNSSLITGTNYVDSTATNCVGSTLAAYGSQGVVSLAANNYYYKVEAQDTSGNVSALSGTQSFLMYSNGNNPGIQGDYSTPSTTNYSYAGFPANGSNTKCILLTTGSGYGEFLPYWGIDFTYWNLQAASCAYLEFDFYTPYSSTVMTLELAFRCSGGGSGDDYIYTSTAGSIRSTTLTATQNAWVTNKIAFSTLLLDYGQTGAGPGVLQTALYKLNFQDQSGSSGRTFGFDNLKLTPT